MKHKELNKRHETLVTFLLLLCIIGGSMGKTSEIYGDDVDVSSLSLIQNAVWTDQNRYQGEITVECQGLETVLSIPKEPVQQEEAAGGLIHQTEEPSQVTEMSETENQEEKEISDTEENSEDVEVETEETQQEEQMAENDSKEEVLTGEQMGNLSLVYILSEYFSLSQETLPKGCTTEELAIQNQSGEQDTVTKITCPVSKTDVGAWQMKFSVILREDYRIGEHSVSYPTAKPLPIVQESPGTGIYLVQKQEETITILAQAKAGTLEVPAQKKEFSISLSAGEGKAGETISCELDIQNQGKLPIENLRLETVFSGQGPTGVWEAAEGFPGGRADTPVVLENLPAGDTKQLTLLVTVPKEWQDPLTIAVRAAAQDLSGELIRETEAVSPITPLKADFTVEKTADRTIAYPGETITYQICIRNTGERTLHSVVSTEKFLSAGMTAQFTEKAGVTLNNDKTQALIPEIPRGAAAVLEARVTVPANVRSQELLNQVIVVTKETGSHSVQSKAGVQVYAPEPTISPAPTPGITQGVYQLKSGGSMSKSPSSYPKTGDPSEPETFAGLLAGGAGMALAVCWHRRKRKTRANEGEENFKW